MAKKKMTQQSKTTNQQDNTIVSQETHTDIHPPKPTSAAMEDAEKLKQLNVMLLKETTERRLQVESLGKEKEALEAALARSRTALEAELSRAGEEVAQLEVEKGVLSAFVATQLEEMGSEVDTVKKNGAFTVGVLEKEVSGLVAEIESQRSVLSRVGLERDELRSELNLWVKEANGLKERVVEMVSEVEKVKKNRDFHVGVLEKKVSELVAEIEGQRSALSRVGLERDEVRSELDHWVKEANGLKERVVEMEERERKFAEELAKLRNEHQALIEEKEVREGALEAASRENDLLERNLAEKVGLIENLKMEIEEIVREKSRVEAEKQEQQGKIIELGNNVVNLDEIVSKLQKEEILLQGKVREFEKKSVEAMEMEKEVAVKINALVEENKDKEAMIHGLLGEKSSLTEQLEAIKMDSEDMGRRLEALSREKNDVEDVKASQESEIANLHREASKLRDDLSVLQHLCQNQEEKNKQLLSDLSHHRDAFEKALCEKENLKKNFDEKCDKIVDLNEEVAELNKRIKENVEALEQMKAKHEQLQEEKSQIESRADSLAEEKDSLEKKLSHAEQCMDSMRLKVESLGTNSEQALALLKNTATLVSQSKIARNGNEDMGIAEGKLQPEIQPYLAELEVIKKAFSNKEKMVEDLNRKLEGLGNSVEEAHKKKSFWTLVSSATTVFAAISIAYAARGR